MEIAWMFLALLGDAPDETRMEYEFAVINPYVAIDHIATDVALTQRIVWNEHVSVEMRVGAFVAIDNEFMFNDARVTITFR